jgi:hypothetical protein
MNGDGSSGYQISDAVKASLTAVGNLEYAPRPQSESGKTRQQREKEGLVGFSEREVEEDFLGRVSSQGFSAG